jgi:hypothetical protein
MFLTVFYLCEPKVGHFDELQAFTFHSVKLAKAALEWLKRSQHELMNSYANYHFYLWNFDFFTFFQFFFFFQNFRFFGCKYSKTGWNMAKMCEISCPSSLTRHCGQSGLLFDVLLAPGIHSFTQAKALKHLFCGCALGAKPWNYACFGRVSGISRCLLFHA